MHADRPAQNGFTLIETTKRRTVEADMGAYLASAGAIVTNGTVTNGVTCTQPTCYVYSGTISTPDQQVNVRSPSSLWQIQIGIRYEF